jgi:type III restriction enzyme
MGGLALFRNFDEHGNQLARPHTLLIDSAQIESGDALDPKFRAMASDEIDRFRREIIARTGDQQQAENITDQDLLREVMNTVGKVDRLGESIRCVVSVSMLTEGWDANTVTHVLGVRAFGTQLLCEQVIGEPCGVSPTNSMKTISSMSSTQMFLGFHSTSRQSP